MKKFEVYREVLEDLIDRFICFVRRKEPTIPFDDVVAELERDGILKKL